MGFFFLKSDYANEAYEALRKELSLEQSQDFFRRTLFGAVDGGEITVEGDRGGTVDRVVVRASRNAPRDLYLFPADELSVSGVPSHDAGFDRKVHAGGSRARIAAILDEATRDAIADIVWAHGAVYNGGAFVLDAHAALTVTGGPLAGEIDGRRFARFLRRVVAVATRLAERAQRPLRPLLVENVLSDPRTGVRQKNLCLLIERFPESVETARAARSVLDHHDWRLRLSGAMYFSRRDPPDLGALERIYRDERAPREVADAALRRALEVDDPARRRARIVEVLEAGTLVEAALLECRKAGEPPPDEVLAQLLVSADGTWAPEVIRYVADLGRRHHEPLLVRILEGEHLPSRFAAVDALGRIGTAHAAEALYALANGILTPARLRRAALDAIEEIRERGGYEAGRLSLANPPTDGSVSLSDGGEVSLARSRGSIQK